MRNGLACIAALALGSMCAAPAIGAVIYNNLTPNNMIGVATRPESPGAFEIEAADDFFLGSQTIINSATFDGLIVPAGATITDLVVEIYRVFPADSNTTRTPNVPTRTNSPSDVAFDSRDSAAGELSFTSSVLSTSFSTLNSIQPGGIHPSPGQTTGGNGPLTGQEVQINVTLNVPFNLPADHYFFVPQVELSNGAQFYWLSADRPITGAGGTTPFPTGVTDLQSWTRDAMLDPDWLRVGMDIVGGTPPPTFNQAFSLDGTVVPEPGTIAMAIAGLALIGVSRLRRN
jgi:PEP-CTERM motif